MSKTVKMLLLGAGLVLYTVFPDPIPGPIDDAIIDLIGIAFEVYLGRHISEKSK